MNIFKSDSRQIQEEYRSLAKEQPLVFILLPDGTEQRGYTKHVWNSFHRQYDTYFYYRDQLDIRLEKFKGVRPPESNSKASREYKKKLERDMNNQRLKRELGLNKKKD